MEKNSKTNELKIIKSLAEKLMDLMQISSPVIKISRQEEAIRLDIDSPDRGILIGNNGEAVSSLQLILSLMVYQKTGNWQRLVVNVGDFLEKREENLTKMAVSICQRVKFSGQEAVIPNLNSAERRIVHLSLADNPDVMTESVGEGRERYLIIKPKKQKSE